MKTFFICFVITPILYFFLMVNSSYIGVKATELRISMFGHTLRDLLEERSKQADVQIHEINLQHAWRVGDRYKRLSIINSVYCDLINLDQGITSLENKALFRSNIDH